MDLEIVCVYVCMAARELIDSSVAERAEILKMNALVYLLHKATNSQN